MKTVVENPVVKKEPSFIARTWEKIITIGITDSLSDWEKKRSRLLNGICAMSAIILALYCIGYSDKAHRLTFWESFQGVVAMLITLSFNHFHKHLLACHFFNIYNVFCYSVFAITHGEVDAAEYILVAGSIASMLFFRKWYTVVIYFLLNAAAFAFCKYTFTIMEPVLFMPNNENLYVVNHVTMFVIIFLIVFYFKSENARQESLLEKRNVLIAEEKQKSDNLLLNILPEETAEELKATGSARAKFFKSVTVMFTDFKNFTGIAEAMTPEELVDEINNCYSAFDLIMEKYGVEKIKTVGDAYMCAGGIPQENETHPFDVIHAALDIQAFMNQYKSERQQQGKSFFELRTGIHTGSVVAGIVGTKKFAYDIWGDTVNIASRMESSGETGKINISGATYEFVKNKFNCIHRGKIDAKNKGEIDMYFVESKVF